MLNCGFDARVARHGRLKNRASHCEALFVRLLFRLMDEHLSPVSLTGKPGTEHRLHEPLARCNSCSGHLRRHPVTAPVSETGRHSKRYQSDCAAKSFPVCTRAGWDNLQSPYVLPATTTSHVQALPTTCRPVSALVGQFRKTIKAQCSVKVLRSESKISASRNDLPWLQDTFNRGLTHIPSLRLSIISTLFLCTRRACERPGRTSS